MFRKLSVIIILLQAVMLSAAVIHVPLDQATIQAGIGAAAAGDTVLVERGRYYENINFRGRNITLASRYLLSGDLADIDSTVIDGSSPANPDTASCALFISGEDSTAVLCGFTLTGGRGTKWPDEHSAGTYREGGGVLVALCSPTIRNNRIIGNQVTGGAGLAGAGGAGIRAGDGDPRILNNVIALNSGADYGGGIVLNYCGAVVRNNIIYMNHGGAAYGGGGLWLNANGTQPKLIENNTIVGNVSGSAGGGINFIGGATATVRNDIIRDNTAVTDPQLTAGHAATYSDIQGGWSGSGNVDSDPLFADRNHFLLTSASPCIDAGDSTAVYNDTEDGAHPGQAMWPAQGGLRSDIGAYGGPGSAMLPRIPTTLGFVAPARGATKVSLLAPLTIACSAPADTGSLSFAFSDPGIVLTPQWNARCDTLTLSHTQLFANLGWYSLVINGLSDSSGSPLVPLPDSLVFRATDTLRPRLVATFPVDGATGVALTAKPSFKFNKRMTRASLQYTFSDTSYHFTLGWYTGDTMVLLLHNSKPFVNGTTYTMQVIAAQDTFGNDLADGAIPNPFSFSTPTGVEGTPAPVCGTLRIGCVSPNPVPTGVRPSLDCELPVTGDLTICLYNALGQIINKSTLHGLTAGRHTVRFGAISLAQGVYFVHLQTGATTAVRKFVVVR